MSWFGANKSGELAIKIEKATSDAIPNGDIDFAEALEISDLIRSKQVPAKEAMRLLKKRFLEGDNSNRQNASLKLIDFCIKNGGAHYISETASKEFMDPLVTFLKNKSHNDQVKNSLLEMIQTWSILVSKDSSYDYINTIYRKLQDEGFKFPEITGIVDSTMIESKVAPEWEDSDACMMCSESFTMLNRKHHCRSCGGVFCSKHSSQTSTIPELGINIPVRVCDNCYSEQKDNKKKHKKHGRKHSKKLSLDDEDEQLRKAIELSMKDSGMITKPMEREVHTTTSITAADEDDEEMKAAIEASLRDFQSSNPNTEVAKPETVKEDEPSTGLYSNFLNDMNKFNYNAAQSQQQAAQLQQAPTQYQEPYQPYQAHEQPLPQQYQQQPLPLPPYQHQQYQAPPAPLPEVKFVDPNAITGEGEHKVVEFVDILSKLKTIPESQRVVDPSLVQLHTEVALMNSKLNEQIDKQKQEIERCQAMYAKSFAAGRLYDDILAYRLKQENQMQKTKSSYAAKVLKPAPALPVAAGPAPAVTPKVETVPALRKPSSDIVDAQQPEIPAAANEADKGVPDHLKPSEPPVVSPPSPEETKELSAAKPDPLVALRGTTVPTSYALPPTLEFPSVPVGGFAFATEGPSAPKEEPVANLIDI